MKRSAPIALVILIALGLAYFLAGSGSDVAPVEPGIEAPVESKAAAPVDKLSEGSSRATRSEVDSPEPAPASGAEGNLGSDSVVLDVVFEGRAVSGSGAILGDAKIKVEWQIVGEVSFRAGSARVQTNSEGQFRAEAKSLNAYPGEWGLALDFVHYRPQERKLTNRTRLSKKPLGGLVDLGDVVFEPQPSLAEGRVVDQTGRGIAGADVMVLRKEVFLRRGLEAVRWRGLEGQECAPTPETGAFELFAKVGRDEPKLALKAVADGFMAGTRQPVLPGDMGVLLTLEKAGAIEGNLMIDEALSGLVFETFIQPVDVTTWDDFAPMDSDGGGDRVEDWWLGTVGREGEVVWRGLRSGVYRVRVTAGEPAITVGEWDDLVVRAGEVTRDPRMQDLDPAEQLSLVELEVVDVEGATIPSVRYWSVTTGVPSPWHKGLPDWNHIALPEVGATELVVSAPGYLDQKVQIHTSNLRVVLKAAPIVTLALPSDFDLGDLAPLTVALLRPCAGPYEWEYMEGAPRLVFDTREVKFASPWLGRVRVDVRAKLPWRTTTLNAYLRLADGGYFIDIGAAAEQRFELPVTTGVIDAARAELESER